MSLNNIYLFLFAFGLIWSLGSFFLGSLHLHTGSHGSHGGHAGHGHHAARGACGSKILHEFLNIHSIAIFMAWFGGCAYLISRHSTLAMVVVVLIALVAGFAAAFALAAFLRFLHSRERVLDPFDYDMTGVLGRVSSTILADGTGEILFSRDGSRQSACARSDEGQPIARDVEVIVTRYEKGVAYVRTWASMANRDDTLAAKQSSRGGGEAPSAVS
jgi:membrane protein implicated in regulation of membrane protease activity